MSEDIKANMSAAFMEFLDNMKPVREAVLGYKRQLEEDGHSPRAVEAMVIHFHSYVIGLMMKNTIRDVD